jgi:hypothetical protein
LVTRPPTLRINWPRATRIIRFRHPPIDLFEDIADPADWELLAAAEARTNPRLLDAIGRIDLVPPDQRVTGPGASLVMAPFTHVSPDRPSRFSNGSYGLYYCGDRFEVALFETIHHHEIFMRQTAQKPGWTSDFRELVGNLSVNLHDIRGGTAEYAPLLHPDDYTQSQPFAAALRKSGSNGLVWNSVRYTAGLAAGVFRPNLVAAPSQGRQLCYFWNGNRVDRVRDLGSGQIFAVQYPSA